MFPVVLAKGVSRMYCCFPLGAEMRCLGTFMTEPVLGEGLMTLMFVMAVGVEMP